MEENMTLEQALMAELQKDVKLKGGQIAIDENGKPLKVFDAIAKSIMNNAMKGDIAAVNFIRNLAKSNDSEEEEKRYAEAKNRLAEQITKMIEELDKEGLYLGQTMEIEQLAQNWLVIENLNKQMQQEGYTDTLQEFRKDGTVSIRINPLHEMRDKYQKQFLQDWKELRIDAQRRLFIKQQNKRRRQ